MSESIHFPEIEKYSLDLLNSLKWNGVAMVEFRIDKNTSIPKLMEINPRFWGSLETAIFAGVDFPYLVFKLITEKCSENVFSYELGKQVRWLLMGDLLWFFNAKKSWYNIKSFFKFKGKNLSYSIFSWSDIGPTYGTIREAFFSLLKRKRRRHTFKRGWRS